MGKVKKSKAEYIAEGIGLGADVDSKMSVAAIKKAITKAKREGGSKDGSTPLKNAKWELFCYLFSGFHNKKLFGNGAQSYLEAYGLNEEIQQIQIDQQNLLASKEPGYSVTYNELESKKRSIYNSANSASSRLLINVNVRKRCDYLIGDYVASNEEVDRELKYAILQRSDLHSKVSAIREWNRVKDRVKDKLEGDFTFSWEDDDEEGRPKQIKAKSKKK